MQGWQRISSTPTKAASTPPSVIRFGEAFSIQLSVSSKTSPWENDYQESSYSQFKFDLGDPHRLASLVELDVTLNSNVISILGPDNETGTATFAATGLSEAPIHLIRR